ncbi:DUF1634 domain-containing protein [Paenibacillus sp.]|jgi:uncharacterized membrane protein|uniref:DUF1634 domain-containing protein n=1 Tax=Paenibacillus sp. TaxID=58172 RepID=UPI00282493C5|nr:DUF1634 domain-containing protein [Paenibacillus sp.]MDR0268246.1 DUF1634 domain-containing protein [Paenibacillus sp.]
MNDHSSIQKDSSQIQDVELAVSRWLRVGVVISAAVIILGLVLFFISGNSGYPADYYPHNLPEIFSGTIQLKPYAVITTGLILLILTPVLRVAISIWVFVREGDKLYVIITSIVLFILIVSLALGKA